MSDLIRREDAIDALKKYEELESNNFSDTSPIVMMTVATIANCIEEIVNLPSAEPERKRGKWKQKHHGGADDDWFTCSACDVQTANPYNFCPNCGADMRGENGKA